MGRMRKPGSQHGNSLCGVKRSDDVDPSSCKGPATFGAVGILANSCISN
jgi:hypothetical protein